ncbi:MAG: Rad52/Rad22 family DNA repair protein, partial [Pseudolabrys sp.]
MLTCENLGAFLAVYIAKVCITVQAGGTTIVREGHGSGEGRAASPGEAHDTALKAAETDATKRRPIGLELYRKDKNAALASLSTLRSTAVESPPTQPRYGELAARERSPLVAIHRRPTPAGSGKSQGMRCGNP